MKDTNSEDILAWMRTAPRPEGHELAEIARHFGVSRERMRDQLRRLVDLGSLTQSDPVTGFADANPTYTLPMDARRVKQCAG